MSRRANGEGTVYFNGKSWTAQITSKTGRRSKTFSTQRKARAWLTEQRRDMDTGDYIEPSKVILSKWWDTWAETYKQREVAESTLYSYQASKKRLSDDLLRSPICEISVSVVQGELNRLSDNGLKRRTVEITRTALQMCLERAVIDRMIRFNPVKGTTLPADDSKESMPLTHKEEAELVKVLTAPVKTTSKGEIDKGDLAVQSIEDALYFILKTGARRGEAVNLKWKDITDKSIHIRGTKTEASNRVLPLTAEVASMLNRRRFTANSEYVFSTRYGKRIDGTNLYRWMREHTGHCVHDLRHTYCTRGAEANINPKVLQTLTGHKRIETLLSIYTHVSEAQKVDAAAKISGYCKSVANFK